MSSKASSSLKELKGLREAVLAEEKARTQALLQNLPEPSSILRSEEPVAPPVVDQAVDQPEESEPMLAEPAPLPPPGQPPSPRAPAPRPAAPPVNRAKPNKEPALIIPLTPRIQERLTRHVEGARWGPAELVMEIMRVALHQGYPAVQCGDELIAKVGTYRTYERNPLEAVLRIVSGQGVFNVTVKPQNPDYQHWLSYFVEQKAPDPEQSAQQVCLFSLQSYLESVEDFKPQDWVKNFSPESYSVALSP
ncbi:MAG: hypothetical protein HYY23_11755 [Verrucomicrobia bacterium]|nr:hypothetical protein [Verrucomicrobiota bacterium]